MNRVAPSPRALRQLAAAYFEPLQGAASRLQTKLLCPYSRQMSIASHVPRPSRNAGLPTSRVSVRHASTAASATELPSSSHAPSSSSHSTSPDTSARPLPDITNTYTLFPHTLPHGPPPSGPFTVSLPNLRKEFLQIQSQYHPDKHPSEPAHSKALALSALVNNAYKTLSDPLLRAQYLLLHNYDIDVNSEDNSTYASDAETLMEVMEAQERIEEADSQRQIEEIKGENALRIEETVRKMGEAFERDDAEGATKECVRLRYWRSLGDGLDNWEPGKEVRLIH